MVGLLSQSLYFFGILRQEDKSGYTKHSKYQVSKVVFQIEDIVETSGIA